MLVLAMLVFNLYFTVVLVVYVCTYIYNLVGGLEHFSIQLGRIVPTDFHIFQRGSNHQLDVYIYNIETYIYINTYLGKL